MGNRVVPGSEVVSFEQGYTLFAALRVLKQLHDGRKVIIELGSEEGRPLLALDLNQQDALCFAVYDEDEKRHEVRIGRERVRDTWIALVADLSPQRPGEWKLEVWLDGRSEGQLAIRGAFRTETQAALAVGASLQEKDHGAFEIFEFGFYSRALEQAEKHRLSRYLVGKCGELK